MDRFYIDTVEIDGYITYIIRDRNFVDYQRPDYDKPNTPDRPMVDVHYKICGEMSEDEARLICARLNS